MKLTSIPFVLPRVGFVRTLGPLEARIMDVVWQRGASTVRDVLSTLATDEAQEPAYTTVMTVMGNLAAKGLLQAELVGRSHVYSPTISRGEFVYEQVKAVLDTLLDGFTDRLHHL